MCVNRVDISKNHKINRSNLGRIVKGVLTKARIEKRLVCGLLPAIAYLEKAPEDVLLCVLPQTRPEDPATHMEAVLLQAFCYENYIPVIQVDSKQKLSDFCGMSPKESKDCNCAIISKPINLTETESDLSESEQYLADFYEDTLEEYPRPIIELPV